MKVIINKCFGGFCVSEEVYKKLGFKWDGFGFLSELENKYSDLSYRELKLAVRTDTDLVKAVEELGVEKASGSLAKLKIVEIPDDAKVYISDYDGIESIEEEHRSWD